MVKFRSRVSLLVLVAFLCAGSGSVLRASETTDALQAGLTQECGEVQSRQCALGYWAYWSGKYFDLATGYANTANDEYFPVWCASEPGECEWFLLNFELAQAGAGYCINMYMWWWYFG